MDDTALDRSTPPRAADITADVTTPQGIRRRGTALTRAIYQATLEELAATSFEELGFDKIALRAGTGKAALYRRWRTPAELVLEALRDPVVGLGDKLVPDTGTLRGDLIAVLTTLAHTLDEPSGRALRPLLSQRPRHPELFDQVMELVRKPHLDMLLNCMRKAADRGEVDPHRVNPRVASVASRMIVFESMERGTVPDSEVVAIVDDVLIPLMASR
jgi:AcrR family transcriptional regulator